MAINKKQTAPWVKVVIVLVAVAFAAGPAIGAIALSGSDGGAATAGASGGNAAGIAQKWAGQAAANDQVLASQPTSYTVLVNQGNTYYDWAIEVRGDQALLQSGADRPMWAAAATYYERALVAKAGDPAVGTDLAISYYYGGQLSNAVARIEKVIEESPDFASAHFNAGIFYRDAGDTEKAVAALQRYLELEPTQNPQQAQSAQQWIAEMQGATPAP